MKKFLISVISLLYIITLNAQTLPPKCTAFIPKSLLESKVLNENTAKALIESGTYDQDKKPREKKYWIVFSDRENNQTYTFPGGSETFTTLDFNEELRIAEISGDYALVYTEPNMAMTYPRISADAICKGWIPMENLLLWDTCLANDRGIYYKAMLCINADAEGSDVEFGIGYRNPDDPESEIQLTTDMKFYFVMKRDKRGKVLLATQHTMNDGLSNKVLYAWVPSESYVPWNQRSCIEPNWEHEAVEYFSGRGIIGKIYENKDLTGDVASTVPFKKTNDPYSPDQYRMNPDALRFPILDGTNDELYECSSFTSTQGSVDVRGNVDPMLQKKREQLEKLKRINLAIVIDGTKSMDPYFPAVQKAIIDGCQFFDKEKYDIRIGILIYRDYADGEGLTEMTPFLKPTDPELFNFLSSGGKYGIKSTSKDQSFAEALYYGLGTALDKFPFDPEQSSLMLVVGDCGNKLDDSKCPTQETLIRKLVEKNIQLFGFQVRNINSDAWNLFNKQILQMIKKSMQFKYDQLVEGSKVKAKIAKDGQVFYNDKAIDANSSDKASEALFMGAHKYAAQGSEISPEVLAELMKKTIKQYSESVRHQIDLVASADINTIVKPTGKKTSFVGSTSTISATNVEINNEWLRKRLGVGFDEAKNQLVGFRGWTLKKDESEYAYFKPVLFISTQEFDELMTRLKPVDDVARVTDSDNRKPYIDAIKALLKSMAPGLTNAEMDQKGIGEVMNMIQGLNATSDALDEEKGRTLLEISDENAVKPAEYRSIVNEFSRKYRNLSNIKDGRYKFFREFNGAKYYWIPIDELP